MNTSKSNTFLAILLGTIAGCTGDSLLFAPDAGNVVGVMRTPDVDEDGGDLTPALDMVALPDLVAAPDMTYLLDMTKLNCVPSLENVGAGDFTIRFTITTRAQVLSAVAWQRSTCDGSTDFWSVRMRASGALLIEVHQSTEVISAAASRTAIITDREVNDGNPHDIVIQRQGGTLSCYIDGKISGSTPSPQVLGKLPPIMIAQGHPCEMMADGTKPLVGVVDNVCLTVP